MREEIVFRPLRGVGSKVVGEGNILPTSGDLYMNRGYHLVRSPIWDGGSDTGGVDIPAGGVIGFDLPSIDLPNHYISVVMIWGRTNGANSSDIRLFFRFGSTILQYDNLSAGASDYYRIVRTGSAFSTTFMFPYGLLLCNRIYNVGVSNTNTTTPFTVRDLYVGLGIREL